MQTPGHSCKLQQISYNIHLSSNCKKRYNTVEALCGIGLEEICWKLYLYIYINIYIYIIFLLPLPKAMIQQALSQTLKWKWIHLVHMLCRNVLFSPRRYTGGLTWPASGRWIVRALILQYLWLQWWRLVQFQRHSNTFIYTASFNMNYTKHLFFYICNGAHHKFNTIVIVTLYTIHT